MTQAANLAALGSNAGTTGILPIAGGGTAGTGGAIGFKNRIINGNFGIDQRYNGSSISTTASTSYTLDRWCYSASQASKFTVQQNSGNAPLAQGFNQCVKITSSSAYTVGSSEVFLYRQLIEGWNVSDLGWGTASAKTVTLSFWVYSSLTGSFGGTVQNYQENRSYPFSYTISAANTWEQKSVTITGDITGNWNTTTNTGLALSFSLGCGSAVSGTAGAWVAGGYYQPTGSTSVVGTNGATWYLAGVQLEVGSAATNFDVRSYGTEEILCKRYYHLAVRSANTEFANGFMYGTAEADGFIQFPVVMRTTPSLVQSTGTNYFAFERTGGYDYFDAFGGLARASSLGGLLYATTGISGTAGYGGAFICYDANASIAFNAEL